MITATNKFLESDACCLLLVRWWPCGAGGLSRFSCHCFNAYSAVATDSGSCSDLQEGEYNCASWCLKTYGEKSEKAGRRASHRLCSAHSVALCLLTYWEKKKKAWVLKLILS